MKKLLSILLSCILVLNIFSEYSYASSFEKIENEIQVLSENELIELLNKENGRQIICPSSASAIAIFIAGIFVGYIFSVVVEGVIISATGNSGAEWVAYAIEQVVGKPYKSEYHLDSSGGTRTFSFGNAMVLSVVK